MNLSKKWLNTQFKKHGIKKKNGHHTICMMAVSFKRTFVTELQVLQDSELVHLLEQQALQEPLGL